MADDREVRYDAKEHTDLVQSIRAESELKPYNIFRHVHLPKKRVVDIGCGDGALSRQAATRGAAYVRGIDGKPDMIRIARASNTGFERKVEFVEGFIEDMRGDASFDIAILSYLLNNAKTKGQLEAQCAASASFLRPGGAAVVYNNNPFDIRGGDFTAYGFRKALTGTADGDRIIYDYRPTITEDIINYYFSPEAHIEALRKAGFRRMIFVPLRRPRAPDRKFWDDYFAREHLPVICMIASK